MASENTHGQVHTNSEEDTEESLNRPSSHKNRKSDSKTMVVAELLEIPYSWEFHCQQGGMSGS